VHLFMSKKIQNLESSIAAASSYKFEDADRRVRYEKLLADFNFIIENNTIGVVFDDIELIKKIIIIIETITDLAKQENIESSTKMWTPEQCVVWVKAIGYNKPQEFVEKSFEFTPEGIIIRADLGIHNSQVLNLPEGLIKVVGSIRLMDSGITELPSTLRYITGTLDLAYSKVKRLPDSLESIGKKLEIHDSPLEAWPPNLSYIGGDLGYDREQEGLIPDDINIIIHGGLKPQAVTVI